MGAICCGPKFPQPTIEKPAGFWEAVALGLTLMDTVPKPRKVTGYQPINCKVTDCKSPPFKSKTEAYKAASSYLMENDPWHNCCTIGADNRVKLWEATELPVKLKNVDKRITFFFFSEYLYVAE